MTKTQIIDKLENSYHNHMSASKRIGDSEYRYAMHIRSALHIVRSTPHNKINTWLANFSSLLNII